MHAGRRLIHDKPIVHPGGFEIEAQIPEHNNSFFYGIAISICIILFRLLPGAL